VNAPDPQSAENPTPRGVWGSIRHLFLQGLVLTVPLFFTYWVFKLFLGTLDGFLRPVYDRVVQDLTRDPLTHVPTIQHLPGLGFVSAILAIFLVGLLTRNWVGKMALRGLENLLLSIPIVKTVYHAAKQLMDAFSGANKSIIFREVLLVEYPRLGMYSIGFVTNRIEYARPDGSQEQLVNVYIPHPPNPTSGMFILLPPDQVHPLDLSVEEGLKLVLSGGIVSPTTLYGRARKN
jgi:uncharacterized membrane protein